LSFCLTFSTWHSNTCRIYLQVAFLEWFFNTFEIAFTRKILQMNSHICFNFVPYLTRSHPTSNCTYPWNDLPLSHDQAFKWSSSHCHGETLCQFKSYVLCLQFCDAFATHFSSHQFGIATKGKCEVVIHDIKCTLDLHFNWVVFQLDVANVFNSVSKEVIFQELHAIGEDIIQLIPFVHAFYAFEFPMFYNHCNHEGEVIVIPFTMGTHQCDPLGGALFALVHLKFYILQLTVFPFVYFHLLQMTFTS